MASIFIDILESVSFVIYSVIFYFLLMFLRYILLFMLWLFCLFIDTLKILFQFFIQNIFI